MILTDEEESKALRQERKKAKRLNAEEAEFAKRIKAGLTPPIGWGGPSGWPKSSPPAAPRLLPALEAPRRWEFVASSARQGRCIT